jgi:acyl-CoA thioester hydrolase
VTEVASAAGERVLRHRVRYHETDAQRIVFNARYLEWFDVAMAEFFRRCGWDYPALVEAGCDPSLVTVKLEFKRPAVFDDDLDVFVRPIQVGRSSFTLDFDVYRASDGEHLAVAEIVYMNVDVETQRSRPLPEAIRRRLQANLPQAPTTDVA